MGIVTGFVAFGNTLTDVLNTWADLGVFAYALPFLLIFALIYAILMKTKILGENKGAAFVIALAAALLSLQFDYVTNFFQIFWPWAGVGLSILLLAMILLGLFYDWEDEKDRWMRYVFYAIGGLILLVVVLSSLVEYGWWGGSWWWSQYWEAIIAAVIILGLIVVAVATTKHSGGSNKSK